MKTLNVALLALAVGAGIGFVGTQYLGGHDMSSMSGNTESKEADEPLYWVAPMDPNYKRDQPGKSPMGMDLIPVYADDLSGANDKPGTVKINPAVENNLGVKTEVVKQEKLSPRIETVGYIAFDESRLWQTNVRVSGWVEKLYINAVGERVNKGDVLFKLYSPELVKAQEELLNAHRTGRNSLIRGATERLTTLGVDQQQIRQIVRQGKASQTIDIKALGNGVVATLNIREGGYLSPAQSVISAGPIDEVWVDAEVFERQAEWIKAGSQATMTLDALSGREWQGEIDYVYPILDPATRTLRVRLKFANPDYQLKPNMFANIALQPITEQSVLTIPRSSVIRSGGMTRVVLSEGEGKYRSARIEIGREARDRVEVLQGLTLEDTVVTSAQFMLDSESSQSADLSRINGVEPPAETVWAQGEITNVMAGHNMLTINHQPVPEWNWPGMTMDFNVEKDVDIAALATGQHIEFEMAKTESGQYTVTDIKVSDKAVVSEVWVDGSITMLMADFGMITLSHDAVSEWGWEPGEMNFTTNGEVDLAGFSEGEVVRFLVTKQGSDYVLIDLQHGGSHP
ncbi:efflux RND transporter periplasmic adaptor subunit [Vibrio hangzhouensis]|uniref:Membrane fusion protein, Cu(I)/Ag(I) efflux system n=1 Tax=Vibrio hangzhouensis TaxID=462991 RepID=A0A1H6A7I9_9VIBR|nr:efflux RND transporter periplasmic adaptor subunit [Vibrio hangzhouensis]SEG44332.1 membrane fusion protein, Cu(I)/Ag(I) efflux system [Vibrio hangzhouensis]